MTGRQITLTEMADICARKHQGNEVSGAAFQGLKAKLPGLRETVFGVIERAGAKGTTSKEISKNTGIALHSISGRVSELLKDGRVIRLAERREGSSVVRAK